MTDKIFISINKTELPENWNVAKLEDISTVILGQSPASSSYNANGEGLAFFQGKAEFGAFYPKTVKWCTEPKKIALKNDILISVRAPVGPTNLSPTECCIGRGLAALRPNEGVLYKYLLYYLRSIESNIEFLGTGTTFKAISGAILKSLLVSVAPPNEQKRIVEEIEKQFSRLDEAVVNLKRVKANLKRYKASVLKAAVEGKLTEEWRGKNKADIISENIFNIVSSKRISNYNELCKHAKKTGKPKPKKPSNIDTKFSVDEEVLSAMSSIPKEWQYVHIAFITNDKPDSIVDGPFGSSINVKKDYIESGIPVIRINNIAPFKFINDNLKYLTPIFTVGTSVKITP